jgi:uncharacterized protein (TIGR02996 family)
MTEEDAILLDVLAHPDDPTARLIYADWLTDRGDGRADLVREAYSLRFAHPDGPARRPLADRWDAARQEHGWQEYDGLLLSWEQMVLVFRFRLAEAMARCSGAPSVWLPTLCPLLIGDREPGWPLRDEQAWAALTERLATARTRLLAASGRDPAGLAGDLGGGRLVAFVPADSLSDGAAATESEGFFDDDNVPGWDAWVMFVPEPPPGPSVSPAVSGQAGGFLLAWAPPAWLGRVERGIRVNPEECIFWPARTNSPFLDRLRDAGLFESG